MTVQHDVIDPRIDVFAQRALIRMRNGDVASQADAMGMLGAVKTQSLAGIYKEDERVPALRARKMNLGWWELVPTGEDAALILDPASPLAGPPIIVFRDRVRSTPPLLDPALRKAWHTFQLMQGGKLARCALPGTEGTVAELLPATPGAGRVVSNLVPAILCEQRVPRLRLSVWADPSFVTEANLAGGRGLIDDVTLLRTLANDGDQAGSPNRPLRLTLDRMVFPGVQLGDRSKVFADIVARCHAQAMQILAGYGIVTEKQIGARFNAWLRDPGRSPTFEQYARRIVHFLMTLSLDPRATAVEAHRRFDGIGLDIETLAGDLGDQFTGFCRTLAGQLAAKGMMLAVAAGGMISETLAAKRPRPLPALGSAVATQYKMARGLRNVVIRPMAYDINRSGKQLAEWHEDIVDWALQGAGLTPGQLQLGVKTVHGGLNIGITEAPGEVIARCRSLLRPKLTGLTVFALGKSENWTRWDSYDRALNPTGPVPSTAGEPLQAPLGPKELARLTPLFTPGTQRARESRPSMAG